MTESAVVVDAVSKEFRVHLEGRNTLKERFVKGAPRGKQTFKALDNVSFKIPRGSTFGLVGHNGSGKSTALKLLAGVYLPTSGRISVDGRVSALLELGAGFHGELTGRENIKLNGAILGFTKEQVDRQTDAIIEFADIGEFIDAPVKVYSSGMYVRLGFAIAVMLDPEILIVDEIIAVGDEEFQRKCFDYLFKLRSEGVTIALVTHSMGIARELCDEGIWLQEGVERAKGPIAPIIEDYLEHVNEMEAAKASENRVHERQEGHHGSGEVQVVGTRLYNERGNEIAFATPGQKVRLALEIEAYDDVDDAVVGLGVITENGVFLTGASSNEVGRTYSFQPGRTAVDFSMDSLVLQPGTYSVAAAITKKGHTFDNTGHAGTLVVRADTADVEPGYFRLTGEWSPQRLLVGK